MAAAGAPESSRVSDNDVDYAKFVLYVRRGVPACDHLARLASRCNEVIIQDVDRISGPRPTWLRGVPSLVELPSYKLQTGTQAVQTLEHFMSSGVQAMGTELMGGGGSQRAAPLADDDLGQEYGRAEGARGAPLSLSAADARYDDAPRERGGGAGAGGGASLEEMMRLRARFAAQQQP